jgi:hypothetical protein
VWRTVKKMMSVIVFAVLFFAAGPRLGRQDHQRSGAGKTRARRCRSPVFHQGVSILPAVLSALVPR